MMWKTFEGIRTHVKPSPTQEDFPLGLGGKPERYIQRAVACGSHYLTCALIPREVDSKEKLACFAEKLSNIAHQVHLAGLTFAFHPIGSDYRLMDGVPVYKRLMDLLPKEVQLTFPFAFTQLLAAGQITGRCCGTTPVVWFWYTSKTACGNPMEMDS